MAKLFGGIERFENSFEVLDLSGALCTNVEGLVTLIDTFKIIKELNLSNTRFLEKELKLTGDRFKSGAKTKNNQNVVYNFLINSPDFLQSLLERLTGEENYGIENNDVSNLKSMRVGKNVRIMDDITTSHDISAIKSFRENVGSKNNTSSFKSMVKRSSNLSTIEETSNNISPILSIIYLYDTLVSKEAFKNIIALFKVFYHF